MKKIFLIIVIFVFPLSFFYPKKTNNVSNQTVTPVAKPFTSTPVQTAPGMNPPHGQPGHDCSIAVGSPLSSSPVAKPFTSTPVQTAPGMNPPHGQPGHDCSIAVGSPLK